MVDNQTPDSIAGFQVGSGSRDVTKAWNKPAEDILAAKIKENKAEGVINQALNTINKGIPVSEHLTLDKQK